jgi:CRP/FNR family cyclic AMP-dependent transcriptional regulator
MDQKQELLKRVPLFSELNRRGLEALAQLTEELEVDTGRVLMREGDIGDAFYVISDGSVRVERAGQPVATLGPGDFVGEFALVDHGPRTCTVTANSPTRLVVVGHREFHELMDRYPDIARQVLIGLAHRVRELQPLTVT